jgi:hypothetical protein
MRDEKMAKMMMGQIDHAKQRVAALKQEKYGDKPKSMTIKNGVTLLKEIRDGKISLSASAIKVGFDNFVNGVATTTVEVENGCYRNDYTKTFKKVQTPPSTVESALARTLYVKENKAEILRYEQETELYNLRQEAIDIKATTVEDAIVLGDQHAALLALQDFAAFEV